MIFQYKTILTKLFVYMYINKTICLYVYKLVSTKKKNFQYDKKKQQFSDNKKLQTKICFYFHVRLKSILKTEKIEIIIS